jgi:16S rRNA (adenine1518-N6/adenine1519-N6)-dimethyltransferase
MNQPRSPSGPYAKRRFGQNFLVDANVVDRILRAVQLQPDETIIEIGPGRGALTARLVEATKRVIAIELDRELIQPLCEQFLDNRNFELIEADALTVDYCGLLRSEKTARVIANLPYNVATAVLQRLIAQRQCISEMVLMLQREVVDRIMAVPGSPDRGFLSVFVEAYCQAERLFDVSPRSFRPTPKVLSTVVRLRVLEQPATGGVNEELLWQVVSAGFAQRRKTILNNLRNAPEALQDRIKGHGGASIILCEAGVDLQRRAETLTLAEWGRIAASLA